MCEFNFDIACDISIVVATETIDFVLRFIFKCRARNFPDSPVGFGGKWSGGLVRVLVYVRT